MPFVVAGDPDLEFTGELIRTLAAAGADAVEVGVPFSDPLADGPVIQAAYTRTLRQGLTLDQVLAAAPEWTSVLPVVIMLYYNLLFSFGIDRVAPALAQAGISGVIVPDLPPEESVELTTRLRAEGVDFIVMLTPTTPPERAAAIVKNGGGFVYYVTLNGVTGARDQLRDELDAEVREAKKLGLPVCAGFGISKPDHIAALSTFVDGVIVGSALQKILENETQRSVKLAAATVFVESLARARQRLEI